MDSNTKSAPVQVKMIQVRMIHVTNDKCNKNVDIKGVGMIRVIFDPFSEIVYIDIILNTIIEG